jgi:glycosyltransferase involved in cell wall biosynthesis
VALRRKALGYTTDTASSAVARVDAAEGLVRLKIMLVISGLGIGGAERVVVDLADAFAARGHDVWLVSLGGAALVRPSNDVVHLAELRVTKSLRSVLRGAVAMAKLIRTVRPDVVHSHMVHANIAMRLLRLVVRIPRLVSTAHNVNEEGRFRMIAYRLTHRLAHTSTNVSKEAVAAFETMGAVPRGAMLAVHNGIRVEKYIFRESSRICIRSELGIAATCPLLMAVGRLEPQKDYANLLQALAILGTASDWQLAIAGEGSLRSELKRQAHSLGVASRIHFLGARKDVAALLSAADIFVLSSAWEGFPMVVGEAMACGRVIVATDCGGVAEFVGQTGFLVRPNDSRALSEALSRALALEPEKRSRLGSAARTRVVELYSLDGIVDKWLTLYAG